VRLLGDNKVKTINEIIIVAEKLLEPIVESRL
jgi:hypothetical protein